MAIDLIPINPADTADAERIYLDSFPPEERRPWADVMARHRSSDSGFSVLGVYLDDAFAGFITVWRFDAFDYIEHFAVNPALRSKGIGACAIGRLLSAYSSGRPVVLEAEHAGQNPMAARRLDFYGRCGFTAHTGFEYIQPPYAPGLPEVPLLLLSANAASGIDLDNVAATLHREVYGQ